MQLNTVAFLFEWDIINLGDGILGKKEKLKERILSRPKDFTFDELVTLLKSFGFYIEKSGKTGGSRILFAKGDDYIRLHKPHPRNILKPYQIEDIITALKERKLI
jgi:hypothetical protein